MSIAHLLYMIIFFNIYCIQLYNFASLTISHPNTTGLTRNVAFFLLKKQISHQKNYTWPELFVKQFACYLFKCLFVGICV